MPLLTASQLKLSYGELDVFSDVTLEVAERARIGVVGPNGGGKTSLLGVLMGDLVPDGGVVSRSGGLRLGYVPQLAPRRAAGSLRSEVMSAFDELHAIESALASSALDLQRPDLRGRRSAERRYSSLLQQYESLAGYDYENRADRVIAGVGLPQRTLETPLSSASGGERTRAALARALLADPDLLVLDEPTNYLDFKGLKWLEGFLATFSHAFVVVSHDRYFLDCVVHQIWELQDGRLNAYRGNYTKYRDLKAEQNKVRQRQFERQQEYIAREESFIQRYRAGQRAREARGRQTKLERLERTQPPDQEETVHLQRVTASRTGRTVLSMRGLGVGYTAEQGQVCILTVPDLEVGRGSRTAIIGSNGAGKTTLIQTLLGRVPALCGEVRRGHNVEIGYHQQGSDDLPEERSILDALLDARNVGVGDARAYLARFLFHNNDVFEQVSSLSGGERTRLALARLLITEPNVLVLDEPTTHLDIPSREALEKILLSYEGTLLFVSHDRHLISLLADQLWVIDDGALRSFNGTFEEWVKSTAPPVKRSAKSRRRSARKTAKRDTLFVHDRLPAESVANTELEISELELKLHEIELALEMATEQRDIAQIERLGRQYTEIQSKLDRALEYWKD